MLLLTLVVGGCLLVIAAALVVLLRINDHYARARRAARRIDAVADQAIADMARHVANRHGASNDAWSGYNGRWL
jgi:hypothetical protein